MRHNYGTLALALLCVCVCVIALGTLLARADAPPISATVRCAHIAEDTLAHVRMVRYAPHADGTVRVVYRCERAGY